MNSGEHPYSASVHATFESRIHFQRADPLVAQEWEIAQRWVIVG